ncbi:hypothetical protein AKO1_008077 [Acrasis kona]|uniref:Uncharacterized protein n=1 Tax=Acrasis kona TaxID=1008807 RepID=A0AAW2YQP3_9EUKA
MWLEVTVQVGDLVQTDNVFLVELPNYTSIKSTYTIVGTLIEERHEILSAAHELITSIQGQTELDSLIIETIDRFHTAYDLCCNKKRLLSSRRALHTNFLQQEIIAMKESCSKLIPISSIGQIILKKMDHNEKHVQKKVKFDLMVFDRTIPQEEEQTQKDNRKRYNDKRLSDHFGRNDKTKVNVKAILTEPVQELSLTPEYINTCENYFSSRPSPVPQYKRKHEESNDNVDQPEDEQEDSFFKGIKRRRNQYEQNHRNGMGRRRLRIAEDLALKPQQLEYINMSSVLKDKIRYSEELKRQILKVDTAYDRDTTLDDLMAGYPEFTVFCNELLFVMGEKELAEVYPPKNSDEEEELMKIIKESVTQTN